MNRKINRIPYAILCLGLIAATARSSRAQQGFFTSEDVIKYTPEWHGERFPDGRPKVPDDILDRMKRVSLEEAWAVLQQNSFMHRRIWPEIADFCQIFCSSRRFFEKSQFTSPSVST